MPAKKSIMKKSQKQKQQQKQVVNVVINQPVKKAKRRYARRPKQPPQPPREPEISAKQLSPVFIQPPVTSQYIPMQQIQQPLQTIFQPEQPKKQIQSAIDVFEEFPKSTAEPLFIPKQDYLKETDFIMPVDKLDEKNNLIDESFGVFYKQTLKDTDIHDMNEEFKRASLANVDKTPPPFEISKERDVIAFYDKKSDLEKEEKPEVYKTYKTYKINKKLIQDFRNAYAGSVDFPEGLSTDDNIVKEIIKEYLDTNEMSINDFRKQVIDPANEGDKSLMKKGMLKSIKGKPSTNLRMSLIKSEKQKPLEEFSFVKN